MTITIGATPKLHHRTAQYNSVASELAPVLAEVRAGGVHGIREIATCLNQMGVKAPSGEPFEYNSTRNLLRRLSELRLGDPPRSRSTAASNRLVEPGSFPKRTARSSWFKDVTRKHSGEFEGLE